MLRSECTIFPPQPGWTASVLKAFSLLVTPPKLLSAVMSTEILNHQVYSFHVVMAYSA